MSTTFSPDRTAWRETLARLAEKTTTKIPAKPCHDFLYISGAFRRLYPVGSAVGLLWSRALKITG